MPFSLWQASYTKLRASFELEAKGQQIIPGTVPGAPLGLLTSLLGQVAPSLKHLAWTLWVPKESMLAMAARIEVVFILLIGSEFCLCLCFGMVTLLKQERKEVSEVGATGYVYICVRWPVGRPWGVDHVLRPEKDFLVSCSASHGIVSFQILCYRTLPPFTPCKASYIHFSWSYRCPSQAFSARAVYSMPVHPWLRLHKS